MLADIDAQPTLPVKSLTVARPFYETTLGLKPVGPPMPGVQCFQSGRSVLVVYESAMAGGNPGTAVTWPLGDQFDAVVAALKGKGVRFEHYELPGMKLEGDVHVGRGLRLAWLKDPDGNIIHLGDFAGHSGAK